MWGRKKGFPKRNRDADGKCQKGAGTNAAQKEKRKVYGTGKGEKQRQRRCPRDEKKNSEHERNKENWVPSDAEKNAKIRRDQKLHLPWKGLRPPRKTLQNHRQNKWREKRTSLSVQKGNTGGKEKPNLGRGLSLSQGGTTEPGGTVPRSVMRFKETGKSCSLSRERRR